MFGTDDEGLGIFTEDEQKAPAPTTGAQTVKLKEDHEIEKAPEGTEPDVFAVKTQVSQERNVADLLTAKARQRNVPVHSVLAPQELRGYVFVECDDAAELERLIKLVAHARTMLPDPVPFAEIEHFLTPVSAVAKISEGDIVELVSGPFRGEKAKVTRIDDAKEEITVELFEAMVPIPITVKGENVRVLKRHDEK
jgi:transcription termination/antitermination protein NusG